jgi:hypothetical protein
MRSAKDILKVLPVYNGHKEVLASDQSVEDIQKGMELFHKKFGKDYDRFALQFLGRDQWQTASNIFDFLKKNTSYYIEGLEGQTVRNPSAILATGKLDGIDCKNLALFSAGVLDAIDRSGKQKLPWAFRFAQTDLMDDDFSHVFVVINPGTQDEIFIDPIPEVKNLDDRFPIYSYSDKKINAMLYGISGQKKVGFTVPGIGVNTSDIEDIFKLGTSLFNRDNPTEYWKDYDAYDQRNHQWVGSSVRGWVLTNGDDVTNEAINIMYYIRANGLNNLLNSGHKTTVDGTGYRDVTIEEIASKFQRGGLIDEANQLRTAASGSVNQFNPTGAAIPGATNSNNTLLYIGGALLAAKLLKVF